MCPKIIRWTTVIYLIICFLFGSGQAARILGLFTVPSRSHLIVHLAVVKGLVEQGHNVTVVTTLPVDDPDPPYRHIKLDVPTFPREFIKKATTQLKTGFPMWLRMLEVSKISMEQTDSTLTDPKMVKLMARESFDLMILGYFINDFQLGVAAHFKCPVVVNWMIQPIRNIHNMVGNPVEISSVPHVFSQLNQPMSFSDRFVNVMVGLLELVGNWYIGGIMQDYYVKHFHPSVYPPLDEVKKNVSLVLVNHHFSQRPILPHVPAMVEIGGIQVKEEPDLLPFDIEMALDEAVDGAIYFSLGSNAHTSDLSYDKIKIIYSVLSALPQKVIWKWEEGPPPGKAENIIFKRWLPQDDILAHPNLKLFISHCGRGSVIEAEYHGVPIIGLPLFADQYANSKAVQAKGWGITLDLSTLTKILLKKTIEDILMNPKYEERAEELAQLYRDRPMSPSKTAVFWIEYVLRHRGAPHMQSPVVHMGIIDYYSLDVLAVLLIILFIVFKISNKIFQAAVSTIIRKYFSTKDEKLD